VAGLDQGHADWFSAAGGRDEGGAGCHYGGGWAESRHCHRHRSGARGEEGRGSGGREGDGQGAGGLGAKGWRGGGEGLARVDPLDRGGSSGKANTAGASLRYAGGAERQGIADSHALATNHRRRRPGLGHVGCDGGARYDGFPRHGADCGKGLDNGGAGDPAGRNLRQRRPGGVDHGDFAAGLRQHCDVAGE